MLLVENASLRSESSILQVLCLQVKGLRFCVTKVHVGARVARVLCVEALGHFAIAYEGETMRGPVLASGPTGSVHFEPS
jgi:hypothetical protein